MQKVLWTQGLKVSQEPQPYFAPVQEVFRSLGPKDLLHPLVTTFRNFLFLTPPLPGGLARNSKVGTIGCSWNAHAQGRLVSPEGVPAPNVAPRKALSCWCCSCWLAALRKRKTNMIVRAGFWQNGFFADFIFGPPDCLFFADFLAAFSLFLVPPNWWEQVPRNIFQENPWQNPPNLIQKIPRHISAKGPGQ